MSVKQILADVTDELRACFTGLKEEELQDLEKAILAARRVFVAGAGRSLLMIRGMAMRLMHMGFTAYVVGETVTPAIEPGDLLIIASGSGSTGTLVEIARRCRKAGAELALITTRPSSPIGELADLIVQVHAATTKVENGKEKTIQLGANTFEQSVLLIGDSVVIDIAGRDGGLDAKNAELMKRHANLE
ncbi:MAG: 6-phospho-3-hexuloisomerase [Clostridia bacterium]|nr:6-phospho-3-hexuloisomerase [Clostridia bacterium]